MEKFISYQINIPKLIEDFQTNQQETVMNVKGLYLFYCFNAAAEKVFIESDSDEDDDEETTCPQSAQHDDFYNHVCENCLKTTLFSEAALVKHFFGSVCLEDECVSNAIQNVINMTSQME